jgi:uncharacterized protein
MELFKNIHAIDLSLLIDDSLIISDVHIGFEEALNKQGVLVPRDHFPRLIKRMEWIVSQAKKVLKNKQLGKIIVNGDLKHEFGKISDQEWRHTLKFLDFLSKQCEKVILVRGNHDTILGPIAQKRNLEVHDFVQIRDGEVLICHGDELPRQELLKKAKMVVIGHEHPSIALRQGPRVEKYKCFFVGAYKKKKLIVLPSLNLLTEGSALMHENVLSPFLRQKLDDFNVYIVEDKVYAFGKLKNVTTFK